VLAWAKRFAIVFSLGFVIYAYAVGVQAASGVELKSIPVVRSLRYLGGGLMLVGMTLWIAKSRIEGDRPGLNPMFGLLLTFSAILLLLGAIVTAASGTILLVALQAGLASAAAALVVGVLAMFISPPERKPYYAYPWMNPAFDTETDAYAAGQVVPTTGYGQADDLTRIAGIDEQIAGLLKEAGIRYYSMLAETAPGELREILDEAGLTDVDPEPWPDMALLAANGEWSALQGLDMAEQPA
jgi:hypothetical protein